MFSKATSKRQCDRYASHLKSMLICITDLELTRCNKSAIKYLCSYILFDMTGGGLSEGTFIFQDLFIVKSRVEHCLETEVTLFDEASVFGQNLIARGCDKVVSMNKERVICDRWKTNNLLNSWCMAYRQETRIDQDSMTIVSSEEVVYGLTRFFMRISTVGDLFGYNGTNNKDYCVAALYTMSTVPQNPFGSLRTIELASSTINPCEFVMMVNMESTMIATVFNDRDKKPMSKYEVVDDDSNVISSEDVVNTQCSINLLPLMPNRYSIRRSLKKSNLLSKWSFH